MSNNKPHLFAHCAAGCSWEVPHKSDVPYKEVLDVLYVKNLADENLEDRVHVATIKTPYSQIEGGRLLFTFEINGEQYTVFRNVDSTLVLVPIDYAYSLDYGCSYVTMGVAFVNDNENKETKVEMYAFENPHNATVKLLEIAVVELGFPVMAFTGATVIENGKTGTVPAPNAGDHNKTLYGDGTWRTPAFAYNDVVLYEEPITAECGYVTSLDLLPCFSSGHNIDIPLPVGATVRCVAADITIEDVVKQVTVGGYTYNYVGCVMFPDGYYGYKGKDNMTEGFCGIASAVGKANPDVMDGAPLIIYRWWTSGTVTLNSITHIGVLTEIDKHIADGIKSKVATSIDLSRYESEGIIEETYASGTKITTVEFDESGNPTKITDGDGNVTTLTW